MPDVQFERRLYVSTDAAEHFLTSHVTPLVEHDFDMVFDDEAQERFDNAKDYYICNKPLNRNENIISQDHNHFTGYFRGPVHQTFTVQNLQEKIQSANLISQLKWLCLPSTHAGCT